MFSNSKGLCNVFNAARIVVEGCKGSSPSFANSIKRGLIEQGVEVLDLGLCGTEEVYWATNSFHACGDLMITASHNPINFNGIKMVKKGSQPVDPDTELPNIKRLTRVRRFNTPKKAGVERDISVIARKDYIDKVISFVNIDAFKRLRIVVNLEMELQVLRY